MQPSNRGGIDIPEYPVPALRTLERHTQIPRACRSKTIPLSGQPIVAAAFPAIILSRIDRTVYMRSNVSSSHTAAEVHSHRRRAAAAADSGVSTSIA